MTRGFSLLEAVIAIAIVALSVGALSQSFFAQSRIAAVLSFRTMAQREAANRLAVIDATQSPLREDETGQSSDRRMTWRVSARPTPDTRDRVPGLVLQDVEILIQWREDGQTRDLTVRTRHLGIGDAP